MQNEFKHDNIVTILRSLKWWWRTTDVMLGQIKYEFILHNDKDFH